MDQFDQLLTCCICLDRYRTPKLLPCQHSYCMDPCMEGLVDYVKRQVKCPECRAEHRVPYNGIQGFPTNYTLQKFLELHSEITGELPDPNADAIMSRCNVCSEKAYVNPCAHCDKKVCNDCKEAHCDILKREIARVNNQVKRGLHRLEDCLKQVERNKGLLESNATQVNADIDEIHRRLTLAVKERCEYLKSTVDNYLTSELKNLKELHANLDLELTNIQSNADLMEKHMADDTKWDDNELMDCKDIFIKMMDFIRNYDPGSDEYTRRIRFIGHDSASNELARKILEIGEIKIQNPTRDGGGGGGGSGGMDDDIPIRSSGLARSKSDHRLVAEFRRREEEQRSPPSRRRFGESRYSREDNKSRSNFGRYGGGDDEDDSGVSSGPGRFRSRFLRPDDDEDVGGSSRKSMHEGEGSNDYTKPERVKVIDTEDASRGPLSGCIRLADSSRIIQRLKEMEMAQLKPKKKEKTPPAVVKFVPLKPNRELFDAAGNKEETDKIVAKQKLEKQQAAAATASATSSAAASSSTAAAAAPVAAPSQPPVPAPRTSLGQAGRQETTESETSTSSSSSSEEEQQPPAATATPAAATAAAAEEEEESEYEYYDYDEEEEEEPAAAATAAAATPSVPIKEPPKSYAAMFSNSSSSSTAAAAAQPAAAAASAPASQSYMSRFAAASAKTPSLSTATGSGSAAAAASTPAAAPAGARAYGGAKTTPYLVQTQEDEPEASRPSSSLASKYNRRRDDSDSFVNKYLAKSRTSSVDPDKATAAATQAAAAQAAPPAAAAKQQSSEGEPESVNALSTRKLSGDSQYPSGRSRYAALKERRNKAVARSKSSALLGGLGLGSSLGGSKDGDDDADEEEDPEATPFTSRFGRELAKSRSSHYLKAGDTNQSQQDDSAVTGNADDENLSSWARYLKNKYGSRNRNSQPPQGQDSSGSNKQENANNQRNSHHFGNRGANLMQKQTLLLTFGSRGSQPGLFTWPRGIAVGPDNSIVVADSSNHRVQIFAENGVHRFSFGCYGNGEGEFDCLAGVAVNKIGQYIIADRYNHRIQIFDPSGHFLRSFGSQGNVDGKFSYPWGITTDALGFIYVCDKENHRVQIFQSDGTFVGKFGTMGSKPGQLEHPHYIAVSNANRVVVSDSNNHRIQIFDNSGKVINAFGSEGTEEGQFKFPRGVAVDEQGSIYVADSGNNRIQMFNSEGVFQRGFGRWGQGEGEFKGLEGIAVNSKGQILVADRENHRVQMF